jgi:hypothetical protein
MTCNLPAGYFDWMVCTPPHFKTILVCVHIFLLRLLWLFTANTFIRCMSKRLLGSSVASGRLKEKFCTKYKEGGVTYEIGHTIAKAASHWLPTVAAWVQAWVRSCGICAGQSGTGAGFLWVFQFSLSINIPPTAPQSSSSIIWGWCNKPNSSHSTKWNQFHPIRN